jgi:hypothetical protein
MDNLKEAILYFTKIPFEKEMRFKAYHFGAAFADCDQIWGGIQSKGGKCNGPLL